MRLPWRSSHGRASPMALNRPRPRRPARRRGATFVSDGTRQARRRGRPAASSAAPHNCRLPKRAHTIATTRRWMSSAAARSGWSAGRTVGNSDKSECAGRCPRLRAVGERSRGGKARWAGAGAPRRGGDEAESGDQALGVAGADRLAASVEEETSHWDSARPRANSFHFDGATAVGTRPRRRRPWVASTRAGRQRLYRAPSRRRRRPLRPRGRSLARGAGLAVDLRDGRCSLRSSTGLRRGYRAKSAISLAFSHATSSLHLPGESCARRGALEPMRLTAARVLLAGIAAAATQNGRDPPGGPAPGRRRAGRRGSGGGEAGPHDGRAPRGDRGPDGKLAFVGRCVFVCLVEA